MKKQEKFIKRLMLTVSWYLIWLQSYKGLKKSTAWRFVTSSEGNGNRMNNLMYQNSEITSQKQFKFCQQTVLENIQLSTDKTGLSRNHAWLQSPFKDFMIGSLEQSLLIWWSQFFQRSFTLSLCFLFSNFHWILISDGWAVAHDKKPLKGAWILCKRPKIFLYLLPFILYLPFTQFQIILITN